MVYSNTHCKHANLFFFYLTCHRSDKINWPAPRSISDYNKNYISHSILTVTKDWFSQTLVNIWSTPIHILYKHGRKKTIDKNDHPLSSSSVNTYQSNSSRCTKRAKKHDQYLRFPKPRSRTTPLIIAECGPTWFALKKKKKTNRGCPNVCNFRSRKYREADKRYITEFQKRWVLLASRSIEPVIECQEFMNHQHSSANSSTPGRKQNQERMGGTGEILQSYSAFIKHLTRQNKQ